MYRIDLGRPGSVYFIGIGGISMSALAQILLSYGFKVSGSDASSGDSVKKLEELGAAVHIGHAASNIGDDVEAVVYTAAIHPDNPEFAEAKRRGLPLVNRAVLLGQMMEHYACSVAVAGTHGKTTTTSMLSQICMDAGADPTVLVGGMLDSIGGNLRIGGSECFVAEACEYTNSFLEMKPWIGIILNIRADHLDFFRDIDDIRDSFHRFACLVQEGGLLVINADIDDVGQITEGAACRVMTFGLHENADITARDIAYGSDGCAVFDIVHENEKKAHIALEIPGEHNVADALAAACAARALGISWADIEKGLDGFSGTRRRFEVKGQIGGIEIVDDYAHHPDEIRATLEAARRLGRKRVWCVFQSHTYTRTKALMHGFAEALCLADEIVLAKIYPARETDTLGISAHTLADEIERLGRHAYCFDSFDEIEIFLLENAADGDLIITMGAGDIVKVGEVLLGM